MKVLNLRCSSEHGFEGWFGSEDDYLNQQQRQLLQCPLCGDPSITRLPSAPRLNLSGRQEPRQLQTQAADKGADPGSAEGAEAASSGAVTAPSTPGGQMSARATDLQAAWMHAVRQLMDKTEDVGDRFAEKARRIHYGEETERGIRGQATAEEREALREEGIETMAIPIPLALKGPLQ